MNNDYLVIETPQLSLNTDFDACVTEVLVRGRWNSELRSAVASALRACLAETPRAVVVDLADLADPTGASAAAWETAGQYAATWHAPTDLVLCSAPAAVLQRLSGAADGVIHAAATLPEARARAWQPRPCPRRTMALPPEVSAAALGRAMVTEACHDWGLPQHADPARLILHELIINAAEHAMTDMVAAVSLRGSSLHLAVQDREPAFPHLLARDPAAPGNPIEQRGTGLRMVRAAATTWGALPCTVGKVVWACMNLDRSGTPHDPLPRRRRT